MNIIGIRELKSKLSPTIKNVINDFCIIICGNMKRNQEKSATIISTEILNDILSIYKFNPIIRYDKQTFQFEGMLDEISIYGCADTKEEVVEILIDLVIDSTEDYFENINTYAKYSNQKEKYPYFLRIYQCKNREEIMKVLNLNE